MVNAPGRHTQELKLTKTVHNQVIIALTKDRKSRRKHIETHHRELKAKSINILQDSIQQIIYNTGYSFTRCNYKPKLSYELQDLQKVLAQ
jgi:hypothetical protein